MLAKGPVVCARQQTAGFFHVSSAESELGETGEFILEGEDRPEHGVAPVDRKSSMGWPGIARELRAGWRLFGEWILR